MAMGVGHVFPGFLIPVLIQLKSFLSHWHLFSHVCFSRDGRQNYARKKVHRDQVSNLQTPGHESNTPLSHPGEAIGCLKVNAYLNVISIITATSAPVNVFLGFFLPVLCTNSFQVIGCFPHNHWKNNGHSLIHNFEIVPNSKKLQTTTEIWLFKDFKIQIA